MRVPTLGTQVRPQAAPDVRLSPAAPSAAFPGAVDTSVDLGGVTKQVGAMHEQAVNEMDQVAISAADAAVVRAKTARLWDPNSGAMNARGKDAIPASDAAQKGFQEDAAKIEEGLNGDRQKMAFRRRVDMHYADLGGQLGQHVASQIKQYDHDTTDGHLQALTDAAVASYQDPDTVQRSIDDTKAVATDFWRRNGHADGDGVDDFAKQHIAERVSAIRASVFDQMSSAGQDLAAAQYFEQHKDEFTGHDRVVAEKVAKAGSSRALAQTETQRILGAHGDSLTDAISEAEKIAEPSVQDDVVRRIRQHYADKASDLLHVRQQTYQQASSILEKNGGNMDAIPLKLRATLLPGENEALQHRADQIRHPKDFGDSAAYYHALNLAHASPSDRSAFAGENFATGEQYKGLSETQRSHLLALQYQVHKEMAHDSTKAGVHPAGAANVAATPVAPVKPYNPLAGILAPIPEPTREPTKGMLEDVARKGPGYAKYLRGMGYKVPAGAHKAEP